MPPSKTKKKTGDSAKAGSSIFSKIKAISKKYDAEPIDYKKKGKFTQSIPTGIKTLDADLNYGAGIPLGIICEFFGKESGGKSYFAQKMCANAQKAFPDKAVVYVDLENSLMEKRLRQLGVDVSEERFIELPNVGDADKTFDNVQEILEECGDDISLIVIDSLKAVNKEEWIDDTKKLASFLSGRIPRLHALCIKKDIVCILINQVRVDLAAAMSGGYYKERTPGGDTVGFFAQLRLKFSRTGKAGLISVGDSVVGHSMEIHTAKSKIGIPLRKYYAPLYYVHVTLADRLFNLGRQLSTSESTTKIISVRNEVYKFGEHKVEGEDEFKKSLFEDNRLIDLYDELSLVSDVEEISREEVVEHYNSGPDINQTDLTEAMSIEEYEKKLEKEEAEEMAELERQKYWAQKKAPVEMHSEDIAEI